MLTALLLLMTQSTASDPPEPAEIVVVATRGKCGAQVGGQLLSNRELDRHAAEWSNGREVRILVRPGASYRCMAKIMVRLADRGVQRAYSWSGPPSPDRRRFGPHPQWKSLMDNSTSAAPNAGNGQP